MVPAECWIGLFAAISIDPDRAIRRCSSGTNSAAGRPRAVAAATPLKQQSRPHATSQMHWATRICEPTPALPLADGRALARSADRALTPAVGKRQRRAAQSAAPAVAAQLVVDGLCPEVRSGVSSRSRTSDNGNAKLLEGAYYVALDRGRPSPDPASPSRFAVPLWRAVLRYWVGVMLVVALERQNPFGDPADNLAWFLPLAATVGGVAAMAIAWLSRLQTPDRRVLYSAWSVSAISALFSPGSSA
jgi:hypothetical protein